MTTAAAEKSRDELRRRQREAFAMRSGWPELDRRHLNLGPFGIATDERDGTVYVINRGEILGVDYSNISAFFFSEDGDIILLERRQGSQR